MNNLLSEKDCEKVLFNNIKTSVKIVSYEYKKVSEEPLGYLGEHLFLHITYINEEEDKKIVYFVKCLPQSNKEQQTIVAALGIIQKEGALYEKLLSKLQNLVSKQFCPELFLAKPDVLVMENLQTKGYKMCQDFYLDQTKICSVLNTLARIHAACIVLEEKQRCSLIDDLALELTEYLNYYRHAHVRYEWFKASTICVAKVANYFTKRTDLEEKMLQYFENVLPGIDSIDSNIRNVLLHGDLWNNNLLFDEKNECVFVDFQSAKYGPPASDFWDCLFYNLEYDGIHNHLEYFINYYYDKLGSELDLNNLDVKQVLPMDDFLKTLSVYKQPVLLKVCVCLSYVSPNTFNQSMMNNKDVYDEFNFGDRSKFLLKVFETDKQYECKLKSLIVPLANMF
ncbi:uncharacterized protein LOC126742165 [Anthonomus grandis grandis]|uniref:uncharacterized protein LOC126742165 n=1 Tax=Anthonomus grandis grandis TaxID=2921223 RepID=UPI0021669E0E|nr:uncharacterized protein LOC126742165 [Anthonomus grandis grandis]